MLFTHKLNTRQEEMHDITSIIKNDIKESKISEALCTVYCPHTTAGITINEGYDPDVKTDFLAAFHKLVYDDPAFLHSEGNSAAHIKSSIIGAQQTLIIQNSILLLGRWQAIYFCEFDGPRNRTFYVKIQ